MALVDTANVPDHGLLKLSSAFGDEISFLVFSMADWWKKLESQDANWVPETSCLGEKQLHTDWNRTRRIYTFPPVSEIRDFPWREPSYHCITTCRPSSSPSPLPWAPYRSSPPAASVHSASLLSRRRTSGGLEFPAIGQGAAAAADGRVKMESCEEVEKKSQPWAPPTRYSWKLLSWTTWTWAGDCPSPPRSLGSDREQISALFLSCCTSCWFFPAKRTMRMRWIQNLGSGRS